MKTSIRTAHSLLKCPVLEDEDRGEANIVECKLSTECNPKRLELVQAAAVIVWDGFPSNIESLLKP